MPPEAGAESSSAGWVAGSLAETQAARDRAVKAASKTFRIDQSSQAESEQRARRASVAAEAHAEE
jgi:hypothetical protein